MAGFIYVMRNPAFRDELIKIGKSDRDPTARQEELFTTGVPQPFSIEYFAFVTDHHAIERRVHQLLATQRFNENREFFNCSTPQAIAVIRELAGSELKYEEVFYKNAATIEHERRKLLAEKQKQEVERQEQEKQIKEEERQKKTAALLSELRPQLQTIVDVEFERGRRLNASKGTLLEKVFGAFSTDQDGHAFETRLREKLLSYIVDRVTTAARQCATERWDIARCEQTIENMKAALRFLTRARFAEYYGEKGRSSGGDGFQAWSETNSAGQMHGQSVVLWDAGNIEQGRYQNGQRIGEFFIIFANKTKKVVTYDADGTVTNVRIPADEEMSFHRMQDETHYSKLLRK